jgi:hypothetical protein
MKMTPDDEARLTAYGIGELDPSEQAGMESLLAANADTRHHIEATRSTAALLQEALSTEAAPATDEVRRRALFDRSIAAATQGEVYRVITHPPVNSGRNRMELLAIAAGVAITAATLTLICTSIFRQTPGKPIRVIDRNPTSLPMQTSQYPLVFLETDESTNPFIAHLPRDMVIGSSEHPVGNELAIGLPGAVWIAPARSTTGPAAAVMAVTMENPFLEASHHPISTFGFTASDQSYRSVRQAIEANHLPPRESVRIEELVNFFPYAYRAPAEGETFAANIEVSACPWQKAHRLMRIGLKAKETAEPLAVADELSLQVEFNPLRVQSYRLLGYDQQMVARPLSGDDTKHNQIKGGRQVTALYEIVLNEAGMEAAREPLRYQQPGNFTVAARSNEVATLQVNYREPGGAYRSLTYAAADPSTERAASPSHDFNFAAAVAGFGLVLQQSPHRGTATYDSVLALAEGAQDGQVLGERAKFVELIRHAKKL